VHLIGPFDMVALFEDARLKVWPVNPSYIVDLIVASLQKCLRVPGVDVDSGYGDDFSPRFLDDIFEIFNQKFLRHLIRVNEKRVVTRRLVRMELRVEIEVIEWSLEHSDTLLEMFENTFNPVGDSIGIHDDVNLILIVDRFRQKV